MPRILLIHPNAGEAAERAGRIRRAGFDCETFSGGGGNPFRALADNPPAGIVIDLARVPSQGGAMAVAFRQRKATRTVPLVMVEGDPEKTEKVRSLVPDAVFATWTTIGAALRRALQDPPEHPIVPDTFAAYAGAPLAQKLRIREDSVVALLNAPDAFEGRLAPLPQGVRLQKKIARADVILAFFTSAATLGRQLPALAEGLQSNQTLWLIWPKKNSTVTSDLSQPAVRKMGLDSGLVDYKICAVDETWSGLAFAKRE